MSLLTVVRDVCTSVGAAIPTSVFSAITNNRTMAEMLSLANEMAQRIAYDSREWQMLKGVQTYTGDGVKIDFDLPQNFKRMLLTAQVWRSITTQYPMRFYPDMNDWIHRRMRGYFDAHGEWTIYGNQMHIHPPMPVGVTATFAYINKNCVSLASGGVNDSFLADGDSFLLGDRLLKLGMIWQWKAQKGSPYAEDLGSFGDAMLIAMGNDSPSPIIVDRLPISAAVVSSTIDYPVPTP
jgi:hypothetical protein